MYEPEYLNAREWLELRKGFSRSTCVGYVRDFDGTRYAMTSDGHGIHVVSGGEVEDMPDGVITFEDYTVDEKAVEKTWEHPVMKFNVNPTYTNAVEIRVTVEDLWRVAEYAADYGLFITVKPDHENGHECYASASGDSLFFLSGDVTGNVRENHTIILNPGLVMEAVRGFTDLEDIYLRFDLDNKAKPVLLGYIGRRYASIMPMLFPKGEEAPFLVEFIGGYGNTKQVYPFAELTEYGL